MAFNDTCRQWLRRLCDSDFIHQLQSMLFASHCLHCRHSCVYPEKLCQQCKKILESVRINPLACCRQCGIALAGGQLCGSCLSESFYFDETIAVFHYENPVNQMISQYKFYEKLSLAELFAQELATCIRNSKSPMPDIILPVPLHPKRLAQRGFNQSWEIARRVGPLLHCPTSTDILQRTRNTPAQTTLQRTERQHNLRDAFQCTTRLDGKRVAIIDDVLTTGSTLSEIARCLKENGAASVVTWVIARTPH